MLARLDLRLRQLHQAMGQVRTPNISSVRPVVLSSRKLFYCAVDFSQGKSDAELANTLSLLVTNIACLKDHLKAWCKVHGKPFEGDRLIDSNKDVAIIHDLWNRDKHFELVTSRSKLWPELRDLQRPVKLTPPKAGGWVAITLNPRSGRLETHGTGSVELVVDATVADKEGNRIDNLLSVAERAVSAWERALAAAGVNLPPRPP